MNNLCRALPYSTSTKVRQLLPVYKTNQYAEQSSSSINFLKLPFGDGCQYVRFDDINYVKADGNYCIVSLNNSDQVTLSKTLKTLQGLLSDSFLRIHQSYIIRKDALRKISNKKGVTMCELNCGAMIPVSRRKKQDLLTAISYIS